jgi:hypothetical protein
VPRLYEVFSPLYLSLGFTHVFLAKKSSESPGSGLTAVI